MILPKCVQLLMCVILAAPTPGAGAQEPTLFLDALAATQFPLTVSPGGFAGAGARVLTQALDQAQFVALGEDHLTREIPLFASAVCDEMAPHGLNALALETSPSAAQFAEETRTKKDGIARMTDLQRRFPESIAFLSARQEYDFAAHCAAASKENSFKLWGLDQEFVGSAGWILHRMLETNPGPKATAAIHTMQRDEQVAVGEAMRTEDFSKLYLQSATDAQIAAAEPAILADGNPRTRELFAQLTKSRSIYREHAGDFRVANGRRATLLKQNFLADYRVAELVSSHKPRVLAKFGDTHLYRGLNELHEGNLGSFLSEYADVSGSRSLHILVLGVQGEHAQYSKYGQPFKHSQFVLVNDPDYKWMGPAVAARKYVSAGGPWTLYDLRQLRFGRVSNLDRDWERVVYGYDLLILIPEITPADLLQ